jgi:PhzF family phenazine biosynthesis protein
LELRVTCDPANGLPFTIVDVFGMGPVSGNPLAVVHDADDLATDQMQQIARYMNLSETVFLSRPTSAEADYAVRIFALDRELPWAGHPTLGACHAWVDEGGIGGSDRRIVQQCEAGLVTIFVEGGSLEFVAPPLLRHEPPSDAELAQALRLLGSDGRDLIDAMWIDNGPGWLGLLFDRADTVLSLKPERSWPAALHLGAVGFHAPGSEFALEARAFHTDQHLTAIEDPATGSFNAAVAQWLIGAGRLPASYSVSQGAGIGRWGRIDVGTRDGAITISGRTRTVIRGTALLA